MCGLLHSTFVTTPVILTGFFSSNSAEYEWCATAGTAAASKNVRVSRAVCFFIGVSKQDTGKKPSEQGPGHADRGIDQNWNRATMVPCRDGVITLEVSIHPKPATVLPAAPIVCVALAFVAVGLFISVRLKTLVNSTRMLTV